MRYTYEDIRKFAIGSFKKCLESGYINYYSEIVTDVNRRINQVRNKDEAKIMLVEYGIFDALDFIYCYEEEFCNGEHITDFSNPKEIANILYLFISDKIVEEIRRKSQTFDQNWGNEADEKTNNLILNEIDLYCEQ